MHLLTPNRIFAIFFIFATFSGLFVSELEIAILKPIYYVMGLLMSAGVALLLLRDAAKGQLRTQDWLFPFLVGLLLAYGVALSVVFGGASYFIARPELFFLMVLGIGLTFSFSYLHAAQQRTGDTASTSRLLDYYFIGGVVLLICTGGLIFTPLPSFNFTRGVVGQVPAHWAVPVIDASKGIVLDISKVFNTGYHQATTKLFGLAAVYFLLKARRFDRRAAMVFSALSLFFLFLSIIAGARGEFVISVVVLLLALFRNYSARTISLALGGIGLAIFVVASWGFDFDRINVVQRFKFLFAASSLGYRDILLLESFNLLTTDYHCLLTGCGFNYFQSFHGYIFGFYPHNSGAEMLITFGALLGVPIALLAMRGAWRMYQEAGQSYLFYFAIYICGVSMKSDSFVSMTVLPAICFFAYYELSASYALHARAARLIAKLPKRVQKIFA